MTTGNSGTGDTRSASPTASHSGQTASPNPPAGTTGLQTTQPDTQENGAVSAALEQAKDEAGELVEQAKEQAAPRLDSQKDHAVDGLNQTAHALRQTSQHLREQGSGTVAQYTDQTAEQVERFAEYLHTNELGEIVGRVESFARQQPAAFVGGSFALGLLAARFLKSSGQRNENTATAQPAAARPALPKPGQTSASWHTPATPPTPAPSPASTSSPATQQGGQHPTVGATPADPARSAASPPHNPATSGTGTSGRPVAANPSGIAAREQR
jgi:hypothetical protein